MCLALFREAAAAGQLRDGDIDGYVLASRAMVCGLARMAADGHLPPAGEGETLSQLDFALTLFMADVFRD